MKPQKKRCLALLLSLFLGCSEKEDPNDAARENAESVLKQAEALSEDLLDQRSSAIRQLIESSELKGETTPCTVDISKMKARGDDLIAEVTFLRSDEIHKVNTHAKARFQRQILRQRSDLSRKTSSRTPEDILKTAKEMAKAGFWGHDITIVEDYRGGPSVQGSDSKPSSTVGGNKSFDGGVFQGRLFLWSYAQSKVVCVAPIRARNSETVQVGIDRKTGEINTVYLDHNLKLQALRAGLDSLVAFNNASSTISKVDKNTGTTRMQEAEQLTQKACACTAASCSSKVEKEINHWVKQAQKTMASGEQIRKILATLENAKVCAAQNTPSVVAALKQRDRACECAKNRDKSCASALLAKMPDPKRKLKGSPQENWLVYGAGFDMAKCLTRSGLSLTEVKYAFWVSNQSRYAPQE